MTTDDRARLEAVAAQCERMGIDDLRTVPVDDPWALAAAIRAALAAVPPPAETGQRLQGEAKSVAYEIDCVVSHYEKRQVVPLDADERQMVARLKMWSKRLSDALASPAAPERTEALEQRIADLEAERDRLDAHQRDRGGTERPPHDMCPSLARWAALFGRACTRKRGALVTGDYLDVHDHSRAYAIRQAEERAEADAASCVVRHARIEQTHRQFWAAVEAKRQQTRPRVRAFRRG